MKYSKSINLGRGKFKITITDKSSYAECDKEIREELQYHDLSKEDKELLEKIL